MKKFIAILFILTNLVCLSLADGKVFYADGPSNVKKVALTFDDGPGEATKEVLEILKEKGVKATFFMLGCKVIDNPKLTKLVADEGHELANHTYGHINFYTFDGDKPEALKREMIKCQDAILEASGIKTFMIRYPYGYARPDAVKVAKESEYKVINWTFGCDWEIGLSADEMRAKYKAAIKDGAIFLMHDGYKGRKMLSFLAEFIDEIKARGYDIVTVSELLGF